MATVSGDLDLARQRVLSVGGIKFVLSASGHPTIGKWHQGDVCIDYGTPKLWACTATGTPGTWKGVTLA